MVYMIKTRMVTDIDRETYQPIYRYEVEVPLGMIHDAAMKAKVEVTKEEIANHISVLMERFRSQIEASLENYA